MDSTGDESIRNSAGGASRESECRFWPPDIVPRTIGPAALRGRAIGCRTQRLVRRPRREANETNKSEKSLIHLYALCEDLRFGRMESMRDDANSAGASQRVGRTGCARAEIPGKSGSSPSGVGTEAAENCEIHRTPPEVQGSSQGAAILVIAKLGHASAAVFSPRRSRRLIAEVS